MTANRSEKKERKSQQRSIKSYLYNEIAHNKHLSINDYKTMTKQVMELQNIENAYLSESLTKN